MSAVAASLLSTPYNKNTTLAKPARYLSPRQSKELLFYFLHLDERNPHGFMNKWDQIPKAIFTPKNYAQILYNIAINLNAPNITPPLRGKILSHIRSDIDAWLLPTLEKIEDFNQQSLTNSTWATAVIDSYYSEDSLTQVYYTLRPYINLDTNSNNMGLQQTRDADLWFMGHSNISNPKHNSPPRKLIFENNIRTAFKCSGFGVSRPNAPLISQLKKAIDFPVTSTNENQKLWAEIDGYTHVLNLDTATTPAQLRYNVHTKFRSALERRLAEKESIILRIDAINGKKIETLLQIDTPNSRKEMNILCNKAFNLVQNAGPGIYRTVDLKGEDKHTSPIREMVRNDRNLDLC